jgi:hypothetical protein
MMNFRALLAHLSSLMATIAGLVVAWMPVLPLTAG